MGAAAFGAKINKGDPAGVTARDLGSEVVREWKKKKGGLCGGERMRVQRRKEGGHQVSDT